MRRIAVGLAVLTLSGAAFADTTTIKRTETPFGDSTTVKKENFDGSTTTRKTIDSTGSVGCDTKSVTKTDDDGDSTTKTRTTC